jgi:hypothetical protein
VIDPETREQWQGVADAWHSAAEAAPPLTWGGRLASTPRPLVSETGYPFRELMAAGQEQPALLHSEVVLNGLGVRGHLGRRAHSAGKCGTNH